MVIGTAQRQLLLTLTHHLDGMLGGGWRRALGLLVLASAATASLSGCAPVICGSDPTDDHFVLRTTGVEHPHPDLQLCTAESCTPVVQNTRNGMGTTSGAHPRMYLFASRTDTWTVAVTHGAAPTTITLRSFSDGHRTATRTLELAWHRASTGPCSTGWKTVHEVELGLP